MKKHIIRILLIVLAVLLLLYAALKVYVAIEAKRRADAPGNAAAYDVDGLEKHEDSPLAGKTILFLGSSVTDWLSTGEDRADEAGCLNAGVDLIMPGGKKVVKALLNAHKDGHLSLDTLRQSCGRVLEQILD